MAELLAHHPRFIEQLHGARPLFFRATVTALQTSGGVRQVQVQRTGQAQPDSAWYPIFDAGYAPTVGDDVLLCYVDQRYSACVIGARTQTSPAAGGTALSTSALGESFLPLTVTNNSSTQSIGGSSVVPVPTTSSDYVVQCHLSGSAASGVWNALSDKTNFSDLQVLFAGAEIDADLDQVTNGAWSSSNQTLWFRLQRPIGASGTDQGYQLRLGGGLRSSPKRSWANIYALADDFVGTSLDASRWSASAGATVSLSGSVLTLSSSSYAYIDSVGTFGPGRELRLLGAMAGGATSATGTEFDFRTGGSGHIVQLANENGRTPQQWRVQNVGASNTPSYFGASDSAVHLFLVQRNADGSSAAAVDAGTSVPSSSPLISDVLAIEVANIGGGGTTQVDWVKVRPYVSPEATVSAGPLQSAGGLRWEPVVDASGSVLIAAGGDPIMALSAAT